MMVYVVYTTQTALQDYIINMGIICAIGFLIALCLTPLANLMGKRVKESQLIDEQGLIGAGVNPIHAKVASFSDQTIRRLASASPGGVRPGGVVAQ
tara:strand:- start:2178 stop:2465 length:288 start_codon:yes stop_codon:yes gene_type:complete